MRRKSLLLNLVFGLVLFAGIGVSNAQTTLTLMDWPQPWRYLLTTTQPAGWSASNFNASAWPQGNGVIGFPANEAMPANVPAIVTVIATNAGSSFITNFYFRTTLTLTTNPNSLSITGMCVVDDGAVIYINGREITPRIAMPAGTVLPTTFASRQDDVSAHGVDTFAIASSNFVQGVNEIAVEVHQGGFNSSDVVWGMKLTGIVLEPPRIVTQPQDQTVEVGTRVTFSVAATGSAPLTYRWFSNNVLIATGASPSHQTPPATLAMNGVTYYATVSNRFGLARSSNAVLTVVSDTTGPLLVSATPTSSNAVLLVFNEAVLRTTNELARWENSISNLNNYAIHILGDSNTVLNVTNVSYGATQLRLNLDDNLDLGSNYIICVYNLQDVKTNTTIQDCIGISFTITNNVIQFGTEWYFDTYETDNRMGMTNWTAINYNESADIFWALGLATLYYDQRGSFTPCTPLGSLVFDGPNTYYFRKKFMLTSTFGNSNITAQIRHNIDDGAVFYLNGVEIGRYNMPAGAVTYSTSASSGIADPTCQTLSVALTNGLLRVGTNVLAVEVHEVPRVGGGNDDIVFDAELSFTYQRRPTWPELTITRSGANVILTWTGETNTWRLERAVSLSGPWTNVVVSPITNRLQEARGSGQRFYRVLNP